jgi:LEA14-like dessication related protein
MLMSRGKIVFILIVTFISTSCGNFSKIAIGEINGITIKGIEDNALIVAVRIPVENPTLHKITITDFDSKVYINDQYLGKVLIDDKIVFPSKSDAVYDVDLNIRLANFFGAALTMMNLRSGQRIKIRMEGELSARSALMKRKIPVNETREVVI